MTELMQQCLLLPTDEKQALMSFLCCSLDKEQKDASSRFFALYKAATSIVGDGILTDSKMRELVIGRMLIVYQMRQEGYTLQVIGKHLGRNHSSVYNLEKRMEDALNYPKVFQSEIQQWDRFQELIKVIADEKDARSQMV
jgi:hypothetical protein